MVFVGASSVSAVIVTVIRNGWNNQIVAGAVVPKLSLQRKLQITQRGGVSVLEAGYGTFHSGCHSAGHLPMVAGTEGPVKVDINRAALNPINAGAKISRELCVSSEVSSFGTVGNVVLGDIFACGGSLVSHCLIEIEEVRICGDIGLGAMPVVPHFKTLGRAGIVLGQPIPERQVIRVLLLNRCGFVRSLESPLTLDSADGGSGPGVADRTVTSSRREIDNGRSGTVGTIRTTSESTRDPVVSSRNRSTGRTAAPRAVRRDLGLLPARVDGRYVGVGG